MQEPDGEISMTLKREGSSEHEKKIDANRKSTLGFKYSANQLRHSRALEQRS